MDNIKSVKGLLLHVVFKKIDQTEFKILKISEYGCEYKDCIIGTLVLLTAA